ncbi:MAG: uracil-DNA glycosylase family protein [Elusimicrobia bacterium]|nr:uracil-DNA glycosylase family protein [Elusimicrobiota bacterium]
MVEGNEKLEDYKKEVINKYCKNIGLPMEYRFYNGIQVKPLCPVETRENGVFVIGAYPSAAFERKNGRILPKDNLSKPFDDNKEVDNKSAKELDENILKPLGIKRSQCWITNLVKTFLFKKEHVLQFEMFKSKIHVIVTRDNYEQYAIKSISWLYREIEMANPKIIITLGNEVAGILEGVSGNTKRNGLLDYKIRTINVNGKTYKIIHMAHPGILMKKNISTNSWPERHKKGIETLKTEVQKILTGK